MESEVTTRSFCIQAYKIFNIDYDSNSWAKEYTNCFEGYIFIKFVEQVPNGS